METAATPFLLDALVDICQPRRIDADYIRTRWLADPAAALAAESAGEMIGSNFVTNWGSLGFFGPLTVRPDFWDKGVAGRLLEPMTEQERAGCLQACAELTDAIYEGLNVEREIRAVADQKLGDTILIWDDSRLIGFAVCHCGAGSESGSGGLRQIRGRASRTRR